MSTVQQYDPSVNKVAKWLLGTATLGYWAVFALDSLRTASLPPLPEGTRTETLPTHTVVGLNELFAMGVAVGLTIGYGVALLHRNRPSADPSIRSEP